MNYLSIYLTRQQEAMKPLYLLTKKKVKYQWGKQRQIAFDTVKELLQKALILTMPRSYGLLGLYTDTSKIATGGDLYQVQDGEERLLAYYNKRLEESSKSLTATELEMKGITICVLAFSHILKSTAFKT